MEMLKVLVDTEVNAAYLQLSDREVASTIEYSEELLIDLDGFGLIRGIELLDLEAAIPYEDLASNFHIHGNVLALFRDISSWSRSTVSSDTAGHTELHPESRRVLA
ncbi:DUF2283 domain-containing protein [Acaricomes phytoseiuli]|uniref:DUF2283 domain-containing protein n=1 Tax=Acaricomes phytoseiuli TaxID=291968 RepID=UPI002222C6A7|nr:DUF2283 domain-containing protein [Acaricomes phytoseiuli]MCW1250644.1 DUF2283 domain-containing protein [Acaricomes phytoseiuli]